MKKKNTRSYSVQNKSIDSHLNSTPCSSSKNLTVTYDISSINYHIIQASHHIKYILIYIRLGFTRSRLKLNNDIQQSWLSSTKTRQSKLNFKLQYTIKNNCYRCTKMYSRFQNCIRKKFFYSWEKCFDLKLL